MVRLGIDGYIGPNPQICTQETILAKKNFPPNSFWDQFAHNVNFPGKLEKLTGIFFGQNGSL